MTLFRRVFRRLMTVLRPWPPAHERRAAIQRATREKERSQAGARHAATLEAQLRQMAADNHFAELITRQIAARHGHDT
jgi:hypothetical protein